MILWKCLLYNGVVIGNRYREPSSNSEQGYLHFL